MSTLTKRATIYLDPVLHKALRLKSVETSRSVSDLVNDAVREELAEDAEDLATFEARRNESTVSFEDFVNRVNAELVNKIVNLASRSVQFVTKRLDGRLSTVPESGVELLSKLRSRLPDVEKAYRSLDYANALRIACEIADEGNLYFQEQAPFHLIKTDPDAARAVCTTTANICGRSVTALPTMSGCVATWVRTPGGGTTCRNRRLPVTPRSQRRLWRSLADPG